MWQLSRGQRQQHRRAQLLSEISARRCSSLPSSAAVNSSPARALRWAWRRFCAAALRPGNRPKRLEGTLTTQTSTVGAPAHRRTRRVEALGIDEQRDCISTTTQLVGLKLGWRHVGDCLCHFCQSERPTGHPEHRRCICHRHVLRRRSVSRRRRGGSSACLGVGSRLSPRRTATSGRRLPACRGLRCRWRRAR